MFSQKAALSIFVQHKITKSSINWRVDGPGSIRVYSIQSSTGVFSGTQLEDSQSEPTVRVSNVMVNLAERTSHGTHISSGRRSVRSGFDFVPEPVEIAAGCAVVPDSVAGVGDPEGSHGDVSLKHGPGLHRTHQRLYCIRLLVSIPSSTNTLWPLTLYPTLYSTRR